MRIVSLLVLVSSLASVTRAQTSIPATWSDEAPVAEPASDGGQEGPQVAFEGHELVVMWEEAGLRVRRLSGHVEVLDPSTDSTPFALAAGPVSTFAAWNNYPDMKAAVVGRSPAFLAQARATPVAVWTGSDFAVAWAALGRVFIARFSAEGERLFELGGGTNSIGVSRVAAIGASGTKVLAVWSDTDLVGRGAVAGSGSTVLTDPIAQREDRAAEFSVAGDGRDFLVTWINQGIASNDFIMGRRVGADGRTIGAANYYSGGGDSK